MASAQFGIIGLGVMGQNLALNIEEQGFRVAVWNLEPDWTDRFMEANGGKGFVAARTFGELTAAVERPRRILMMISAGKPVDQTIDSLLPFLDEGDVLIDGGNSWFRDTQERSRRLEAKGIHFVGAGISGGEDGARHGASLMPGGTNTAWRLIAPVFEAIAARTDAGACVTHVGPDGSGHFVKMVHNGIEYGSMQLIAEAYDVLRRGARLEALQLADLFDQWNRGPLESFLVEITARILRVRDPETGDPLVEKVVDKAGQKGTGKWTAQVALDLGIPVPTISSAIDSRFLSSLKSERVQAAEILSSPDGSPAEPSLSADVHDALLASTVCCFAQGFALMRNGSTEWNWNIELREIARIWMGGCIIRARVLEAIRGAFQTDHDLPNLLVAPELRDILSRSEAGWRRAVTYAQRNGLAVPAMAASLAYYDGYRTAALPQNLTQAQRDLFGAHTYQRNDKGADPPFVHSDWL
ncbi:MAG TPA: NADP-dependent phosphogluconate dehydrogenase [Thermoanaerobaculia bacterium]|nr:NADP-dependent phosphogluconate dehydrogenase [Thermoanaerobaculia bacterium]